MGSLVSSSGPCSAAASKNSASPGRQRIGLVGVAVKHFAGQHVDELDPCMLEHGVGLGFLGEGNEIRLDHDLARNRMAEQLILMAGLGAAPLDGHALAAAHIRAIPLLLVAGEERGERHVERARQRLEAVDRRRYRAVLDFGQHAGRQSSLVGKLGSGQIELAAKIAHLGADRLGDGPARGSLRRERPGLQPLAGRASCGPVRSRTWLTRCTWLRHGSLCPLPPRPVPLTDQHFPFCRTRVNDDFSAGNTPSRHSRSAASPTRRIGVFCGLATAEFYETEVPEAVTAATWERMLASGSPLFGRIAEWDGQVAGFAISVLHEGSWTTRPCCYLEDLFVAPDLRGRGIARALIEDQLKLCRQRGWSRLYWHTRDSNHEARRLYDRFATADDFVRYRIPIE